MARIPSTWVAVTLSTLVHGAFAGIIGGHGASALRVAASRSNVPIELVLPEDSALRAPSAEPVPSSATASLLRQNAAVHHHHSYPVPFDHDAHPHDPALVHAPLPSPPAETPREIEALTVSASEPVARFVLAPSSAFATHGRPGVERAGAAGSGDHGGEVPETLSESQVAVPARLVARGVLSYPEAARRSELEADVSVQIVVDETGRVVEARALDTPGYGLAEAAERSVSSYRFAPARRDGRIVRVRMRWVVQFRLN